MNHALGQSGWDGQELTEETWRDAVRRRLDAIVWERVVGDVRPFLEPSADLSLLTRETLLRLIG